MGHDLHRPQPRETHYLRRHRPGAAYVEPIKCRAAQRYRDRLLADASTDTKSFVGRPGIGLCGAPGCAPTVAVCRDRSYVKSPRMHAVPSSPDLLDLVASIVSAHVAHNAVMPEALPGLIRSVYTTLNGLGTEAPAAAKPEPAVPVKKSVFPDYIICLEDERAADVEAAPQRFLRHDARAISGALEPTARLSDGGAKICRAPLSPRQGDRAGA